MNAPPASRFVPAHPDGAMATAIRRERRAIAWVVLSMIAVVYLYWTA